MLKKLLAQIGIIIVVLSLGVGCNSEPKQAKVSDDELTFDVEQSYPSKAIQVVIPFAPGGGTDSVARAFIVSANKYFAQPVIAVNKLGDSGARGLKEGLYSDNDGYTVTLITTETNSLSAFGLLDFNYMDVEPLILLNTEPGSMVVSKDFPYNTLDELIEAMQSGEEEYSIGSAGQGSIWHLAAEGIESEANIRLNSKFYDGTSLAVIDVLGGKLDIVIAGISEVEDHLDTGEMKLLTVLSDYRLDEYPAIQTFKESGYDFSIYTWRGLAVPKGMNDEDKEILLDGFIKAAKDDDFIELLEQLGLNYDFREQDDFVRFLEEDLLSYQSLYEKLDWTNKGVK